MKKDFNIILHLILIHIVSFLKMGISTSTLLVSIKIVHSTEKCLFISLKLEMVENFENATEY